MKPSLRWGLASLVMICIIWGNSMVPGTGSGGFSLSVVALVHQGLQALGLPYEWVTNFLVRKSAHFTEYFILGVLITHAFCVRGPIHARPLLLAIALLIAVPSIDETIQLFVPGRCGALTDVLLDCCGAATGLLATAIIWFARPSSPEQAPE